jgi:hypothetical protein
MQAEEGGNRLKRNLANDHTEERVSKRRREDSGNDALPKRKTRACTGLDPADSSTVSNPQVSEYHDLHFWPTLSKALQMIRMRQFRPLQLSLALRLILTSHPAFTSAFNFGFLIW